MGKIGIKFHNRRKVRNQVTWRKIIIWVHRLHVSNSTNNSSASIMWPANHDTIRELILLTFFGLFCAGVDDTTILRSHNTKNRMLTRKYVQWFKGGERLSQRDKQVCACIQKTIPCKPLRGTETIIRALYTLYPWHYTVIIIGRCELCLGSC